MGAWNLLDLAKNTYLKTLNGQDKEAHRKEPKQADRQNPFLRKLFVGFHLAKASLETTIDQATLKENEIKAAKILKKYALAQEFYKQHYEHYAKNATELIIEEDGKYTILDPELKILKRSFNKENPANGYFYIEMVKTATEGLKNSFFLGAVPAEYGISGINTFCISSTDRIIRQKNTGGEPVFDYSGVNSTWKNLSED